VRLPISERLDHVLDVGSVEILDLLLAELLPCCFQMVLITLPGYLADIVTGVQPPLAQLVKSHVVPFDQGSTPLNGSPEPSTRANLLTSPTTCGKTWWI
jgi:hypothetical protein